MLQVGKSWSYFIGVALLACGASTACDNKDACKTVPECVHQGKCTVEQSGACKVGSDQDCRSNEPCKLHGKCAAKDNACIAQTDDDCKSSEDCQKLNTCSVYNGACADLAKTTNPECSATCLSEGKCVLKGGQCVMKLLMDAVWLQDELRRLRDYAPDDEDVIAVRDRGAALQLFPRDSAWLSYVDSQVRSTVADIAEMLGIGVFRCRVVLGEGIKQGCVVDA